MSKVVNNRVTRGAPSNGQKYRLFYHTKLFTVHEWCL